MTEKEWLSRYIYIGQCIEAYEEQLVKLAATATSTIAKNNGSVPGTSGSNRKIENAVTDADEIKAKIRELKHEKRAIVKAINTLRDLRQRTVLTYLYLCGLSQAETALRMHYGDRKSIRKIRDDALKEIRVPRAYKNTAKRDPTNPH